MRPCSVGAAGAAATPLPLAVPALAGSHVALCVCGSSWTISAPSPTTTAATATTPPPPAALRPGYPQAASIALKYLGVPYRWGGASPATGFDCSGLVMYVYAQLGVQLPHQAAAQYTDGVAVPRDQLQPGDLVFFDGLSHVGIYIGGGQFVDAPHTGSAARIDSLGGLGGSFDRARRVP